MDSKTQEQVKRQATLRPAMSKQLSGNVPGARAPEVKTGHGPTARGFEPLRAEPNGFLVHHLSHSVTLSVNKWPDGKLNCIGGLTNSWGSFDSIDLLCHCEKQLLWTVRGLSLCRCQDSEGNGAIDGSAQWIQWIFESIALGHRSNC